MAETPKLSVIVPVYNEKNTIIKVLDELRALAIPMQIIVVDNCSSDGTREILAEAQGIDQKIFQPKNFGKGYSIRCAIPYLKGEYTIIQDGDLEYHPKSFHDILSKAEKEKADAVYGSRVLAGKKTRYASYYVGVRFLTSAINILYGSSLTDAATTYKLVRTQILRELPLRCFGFDLDFELTLRLCQKGCQIYEVPIEYKPRTFEEGKKIRTKDGLRALWVILKNRFCPPD